jgi:hypothetical protein
MQNISNAFKNVPFGDLKYGSSQEGIVDLQKIIFDGQYVLHL